jgi:hypothetical protein
MHSLQSNIIKTKLASSSVSFPLSNSLRQLDIKQNIKIIQLIFVYKIVTMRECKNSRAEEHINVRAKYTASTSLLSSKAEPQGLSIKRLVFTNQLQISKQKQTTIK